MKLLKFVGSSQDDLTNFPRDADTVYVLHAFHKKTPKTSKPDIDLAARRYKQIASD